MSIIKTLFSVFLFSLLTISVSTGQNIYDTLRTVKMTALPNLSAPSLTIQWEDDPESNTYQLYRKSLEETSWGNPISTTGDGVTSYVDMDIVAGELYEYRMIKQTGDSLGYAYLYSGVDYEPRQEKGEILLIIHQVAADLVTENLGRYINVLISEGWKPRLEILLQDATVETIKASILERYEEIEDLTAILLMGNIPVPHSGNINPDGHNDHKGAWPADLYYGDIDGTWTDETVTNVSSAYPRLHNVPEDGNFDQDFIPGEIELTVGRIDFSELPIFDSNEYELLDNYLEKNMAFRTGAFRVSRRAVFKNINLWKEGLGQNAIRNFVPLVSNDSLLYFDFFDAFWESFLWSFGGSSGSMVNSNGLGSIVTYTDLDFKAIFTANFGSYFGDYDFENNYLRTILGSGRVLSAAWVGAPNWYFHPMGLGFDLGHSTLLTQNNSDIYYAGFFPKSVTVNLLGDPTLRAFIVMPPQHLEAMQSGNQMELSWVPSPDNDILGYQVYKKMDGMDYFEPLHSEPILTTSFVDNCVAGEQTIGYLVKAVKREITPSGSFINHSTGPIISITTDPNILPTAAFDLTWENGNLSSTNFSINADSYQWIFPDEMTTTDENFDFPFDESGTVTITLVASNACFSDTLQQDITLTSLPFFPAEKNIRIFPNPAKDFITITTNTPIRKLEIINVLGTPIQTLSNLSSGNHELNVQDFTGGYYIVKSQLSDQMISKMILIKK